MPGEMHFQCQNDVAEKSGFAVAMAIGIGKLKSTNNS